MTASIKQRRLNVFFYLTDATSVYSSNLDLDLSSVDANIPNVVPVDGPSTLSVDFLGSMSQMGDNLLRPPPHSSAQSTSDQPSTVPESTTSTDCPPRDQDVVDTKSCRPSAPPSPQSGEPSSSTGDVDTQTTPPSAVRDAAEADVTPASKTTSQTTTATSDGANNADVDSIEFACNLTFDTTDLIDAGSRHEVIDVRSSILGLKQVIEQYSDWYTGR